MEEFKKMSFKTLDEMVQDIALKFFHAKKMVYLQNHDCLAENDFIDEYSYQDYLLKVENAYLRLSNMERNLINNEFFYQSYHLWWKLIYSKATFYRHKKIAMTRFLEAFYEE